MLALTACSAPDVPDITEESITIQTDINYPAAGTENEAPVPEAEIPTPEPEPSWLELPGPNLTPMLIEAMKFDRTLSSGSTNPHTLWLWDILVENYGKKVISGHCINNGIMDYLKEFNYFRDTVGALPAMLVFEMFDYDYAAVSNGINSTTVDRAIIWGQKEGGIVGFHWHWHMGERWLKPGNEWWASFYTDQMDESFGEAFTEAMTEKSGELYDYIINDIDLIAEQLKKLRDNNIPVLWRPLHEASGTWFWWGGYGEENCLELWKMMYDRMTFYHGLDNLIWICCSHWLPEADYFDMVSDDVGADAHEHHSYVDRYDAYVKRMMDNDTIKILALTETGPIPDIDKMFEDGAMWSFWATWVGVPTGTTVEKMQSTLNDPRVITLEDLPPKPGMDY